jgi:hypothetical protein
MKNFILSMEGERLLKISVMFYRWRPSGMGVQPTLQVWWQRSPVYAADKIKRIL